MKNGLKRLLAGIGMSAAMLGLGSCPTPLPTPHDDHRSWADMEYIVEPKGGTPRASNITYGRIDGAGGAWVDGFHSETGNVSVPWTSGTMNDCTGHWVRIGASTGNSPYTLTLKIKDDGKIVAQKDITVLGNVEYYITTLE